MKAKLEQNFEISNYVDFLYNKKPENVFDSEDFVYCRCCFKLFKRISPNHLLQHNMTTFIYRQLFSEAPILSKNLIINSITKTINTKIRIGQDFSRSDYGYSGHRKDLGHYVRSMIEANFCRLLKFNNIEYLYEPETFKLKHSKFCCYTPDILLKQDFGVWKKNDFLELKRKLELKSEEKLEVFKQQYPNLRIFVIEINNKDLRKLQSLYKDKISLWETSKQNIFKTPELYT